MDIKPFLNLGRKKRENCRVCQKDTPQTRPPIDFFLFKNCIFIILKNRKKPLPEKIR